MTDRRPTVPIHRPHPDAKIPYRRHPDDAGADLRSVQDVVVEPGSRATVDCAFSIALPAGTVGLVCPRLGLASKHGVTVLNAPGIIDARSRDLVKVVLMNHGDDPFTVEPGAHIAQLVVVPVVLPDFEPVDDLDGTDRGAGGSGPAGA